jgi:hypothetical protein
MSDMTRGEFIALIGGAGLLLAAPASSAFVQASSVQLTTAARLPILSEVLPSDGHVGLELKNVGANYPFERPHRFRGIKPNSGDRDYSPTAERRY